MSKKKSAIKRQATTPSNTSLKWPTRATVDQRLLERKSAGAIAKEKLQSAAIQKLIVMDAATRIPMPTSRALSDEIQAAHNAPKVQLTEEQALAAQVEYNEGNEAWTQVNNIATRLGMMLRVPVTITPYISGEPLKYIAESHTLARVVRLLAGDTAEFVRMVNAIYELHEGKEGSALTQDEQTLSREIFSRYVNVFEMYTSVVLPVFEHFIMLVQTGITLMSADHPDAAIELGNRIKNSVTSFQADMAVFTTDYSLPKFVLNAEAQAAEAAIVAQAQESAPATEGESK